MKNYLKIKSYLEMKKHLLLLCLLTLMSFSGSAKDLEGDAARGKKVFWQCRTCHYPEKIVGHNNGPNLNNIFAKQVGSQPGFNYSDALKQASFQWTPELLNVWLQDPSKMMPGNMMMSLGVPDAQDRADLIEYLKLFKE